MQSSLLRGWRVNWSAGPLARGEQDDVVALHLANRPADQLTSKPSAYATDNNEPRLRTALRAGSGAAAAGAGVCIGQDA
jgi:hypothetical protein